MRRREWLALPALAVVLSLVLTGCLLGGTPAAESDTPTPAQVAKASPAATGALTAPEEGTATAELDATPTLSLPTRTPTPAGPTPTPTVTPTPAPSFATMQAADSLLQMATDLQQALALNDREALLKTQRELLDSLPQAEAAAQADQSPGAKPFREAVAELRDGLGGDTARLNSAIKKLSSFTGSELAQATGTPRAGGPGGTPGAGFEPITDVPRYAKNLADKIDAFQTAQGADLLRLQGELLKELQRGEAALGRSNLPQAELVRSGLQDLRQALGGDDVKFQAAADKLRRAGGDLAAGQQPGRATPTAGSVDLQPIANELNNRLESLRNAVNNKDTAAIENARKALSEQLGKAEAQLAGANTPQAQRLRQALGVVREAASGDNAKIEPARAALQQAASGQ